MKAQGYGTLKRKLDKTFSEVVRRRFADAHTGLVACVSCGRPKHWKQMQAGHFVTRIRLATRWDIENASPQCGKCNVLLRGNAVGYAKWLVNRYGQDIFSVLEKRSQRLTKFTRADLRTRIAEFQRLLDAMNR